MWPFGKQEAAEPASFADPSLSPLAGRKPWKRWQRIGAGAAFTGAVFGLLWLTSAPSDEDANEHMRRARMAQENNGEVGRDFSGVQRDKPADENLRQTGMNGGGGRGADSGQRDDRRDSTRASAPQAVVRRVPMVGFQGKVPQDQPAAAAAGAGSQPVVASGREVTIGADGAAGGEGTGDRMTGQLRAGDDFGTATAYRLPDNDLFITMGTPMSCDREGEINTDQIGPFRCKVQEPVYCKSGSVPCLRSGTWMVGVPLPLQRGQRRAFATIRRIETPDGCVVNLRAPVAGPMGEAGMDGDYTTHFWERFRGYALVAGLDALSQGAVLAASRAITGGNRGGGGFSLYQFQNMGRQLGQGGLADDANIPPTFTSPPARRIVVMAMQDIDFRACWRLATTNPRRN